MENRKECDCKHCQNACTNKPGWFLPEDINKVTEFLQISEKELFTKYLLIDYFENNIYPKIMGYDTNIIVNVNGNYIDDYVATTGINPYSRGKSRSVGEGMKKMREKLSKLSVEEERPVGKPKMKKIQMSF